MHIYLAPLQGLTDWIFRESYSESIATFDKTFSPFIRVQNAEFYRPSQSNDILPENNTHQKPVPQFLGNDAASFQLFEQLCLQHHYSEVNINMGCPFPIVVGKGMGAGILPDAEQVKRLLDAVFASSNLNISIKCRLGKENATEFEQLIPIFNDFPLHEIIIHPRVGIQQYKGEVQLDAFQTFAPQLKHSICYNGDILSVDDVIKVQQIFPPLDSIMIGRGILQNPFLLSEIRNEILTPEEKVRMLRNFHLAIIEHSKKKYSGDLHFLKRLEELWSYHYHLFEDGRKIFKQIKKCNSLSKYETIVFKAINEIV